MGPWRWPHFGFQVDGVQDQQRGLRQAGGQVAPGNLDAQNSEGPRAQFFSGTNYFLTTPNLENHDKPQTIRCFLFSIGVSSQLFSGTNDFFQMLVAWWSKNGWSKTCAIKQNRNRGVKEWMIIAHDLKHACRFYPCGNHERRLPSSRKQARFDMKALCFACVARAN